MSTNYIVPTCVEFIHYIVRDLEKSSLIFEKMGFDCVGKRTEASRKSKLYTQGDIRIVLSASSDEKDEFFKFNRTHGDGILDVGMRVDNAVESLELATKRLGAKEAAPLRHEHLSSGKNAQISSIRTVGDVRHSFISYDGGRFEELFSEDARPIGSLKGKYLQTVDHVTVNVEKGQVDPWAAFYKRVFGMDEVRYFDIHTAKTGLFSRAMRTPNGRLTMPFNEPTEDKSQIQEFLDIFKGPGIQHLAFHTPNILICLKELVTQKFEFLSIPETYYEELSKRVPNVTEDIKELRKLNVLVDGSEKGYLLQIFTQAMIGPFFFEFIQRKGDNGFGEGNFKALFESIERDQMRRGYLT